MTLKSNKIIIILTIGFIILNLIGLDRSPPVWLDEVTLNDPAKELALHGKLRSSVFEGDNGFGEAYFWQPPGQVLLTTLVYKVFGFGIWQTRVPVVLFGAALLVLLYLLTIHLFKDTRASLLATALFALDLKFIQTARSGRMDAQCLFFALLGIILYLKSEKNDKNHNIWIICSGLSIGAAGMTHPIALVWAIAIGLLILIFTSEKIKNITLFILSGLAVTIPWIIYALKHFDLFKIQFIPHVIGHTEETNLLIRFLKELQRYASAYRLTPFLLVMYFGALLWFLITKAYSKQIKLKIGILFFVPFFFNAFLMTKEMGYYYLHHFIILAVLSGFLISTFLPTHFDYRNIKSLGVQKIFAMIIFLLLLLNVIAGGIGARLLTLTIQWKERDYQQVQNVILKRVPRQSVIWGSPQVWYAAEAAGAELRLKGNPDVTLHDFVIINPKDKQLVPEGFIKISEIGQPLSLVLGKLKLATLGYNLWLYEKDQNGK